MPAEREMTLEERRAWLRGAWKVVQHVFGPTTPLTTSASCQDYLNAISGSLAGVSWRDRAVYFSNADEGLALQTEILRLELGDIH